MLTVYSTKKDKDEVARRVNLFHGLNEKNVKSGSSNAYDSREPPRLDSGATFE